VRSRRQTVMLMCAILAVSAALGVRFHAVRVQRPKLMAQDHRAESPLRHIPSRPAFVLHSSQPDGAISIPFTLRGGQIHVDAVFDGRQADAIIDTGMTDILCPVGLGAGGIDTGQQGTISDANGVDVPIRTVILSSIQIGRFEMRDFPVHAVPADEATPPGVASPSPEQAVALSFGPQTVAPAPKVAHGLASVMIGNAALRHFVMTIDYRKRLLTLRRPGRTLPASLTSGARLGFTWGDSKTNPDRVPLVRVKYRGQPLWFAVDTGWCAQSAAISSAARKRLDSRPGVQRLSTHRLALGTFLGSSEDDFIDRFDFDLMVTNAQSGHIHVISSAFVVPILSSDADGVFGTGLLSHFRVTLDYPRRTVYLQPSHG
jgi:predicted aspartyl protease